MQTKDKLYAVPRTKVEQFRFDEAVAAVFPDMLKRSVPGYAHIIEMIGVLTKRYIQPGSQSYDLGCSLGAATISMLANIEHGDCKIIAIDNSKAMIEGAKLHLKTCQSQNPELDTPIKFICDDIQNIAIENASVVSLNFTLQFINPEVRQALLNKIYQGLKPGGILVLSEKIHFEDKETETLQNALHSAFKKNNGYSDLEISQKRNALEKVLISDTEQQHIDRLQSAGFDSISVWFRCFNFMSFLAIKNS